MRRGLPYGPRLAPGAPDDGVDRGLVFVCFVADIERQFEFLHRRWLVDGDVLGLGDDPDPTPGLPKPGASFKVPGSPPFLLEPRAPGGGGPGWRLPVPARAAARSTRWPTATSDSSPHGCGQGLRVDRPGPRPCG